MSNKPEMLDRIEKSLENDFKLIRGTYYNPNSKGYDYEDTLAEFLKKYLGNFFTFFIRVPIYDEKIDSENIFTAKENEFDVVATYNNALPKTVFEFRKRRFVPYDATAFIIEVKQTLTKSNLNKDLEKLRKLSMLKLGGNVYIPSIKTPFSIGRPARILFYYERKMKDKLLWDTLAKSRDWCNFLVVCNENKLVLSPHVPIVKQIVNDLGASPNRSVLEQSHALLKLMYYLTMSVQYPIIVNAWGIFETLFSK